MIPLMMPLLLYPNSRDARETVLNKYNEALVTSIYAMNVKRVPESTFATLGSLLMSMRSSIGVNKVFMYFYVFLRCFCARPQKPVTP
jgi:hypothetical protein